MSGIAIGMINMFPSTISPVYARPTKHNYPCGGGGRTPPPPQQAQVATISTLCDTPYLGGRDRERCGRPSAGEEMLKSVWEACSTCNFAPSARTVMVEWGERSIHKLTWFLQIDANPSDLKISILSRVGAIQT